MIGILAIAGMSLVFTPGAWAKGESRFALDALKIRAILENPQVERKFPEYAAIESIVLKEVAEGTISYQLSTGECRLDVELGYDSTDAQNPVYRVTRVSELNCPHP